MYVSPLYTEYIFYFAKIPSVFSTDRLFSDQPGSCVCEFILYRVYFLFCFILIPSVFSTDRLFSDSLFFYYRSFLFCVVSYCQCGCLLVVRFGHWVCGESWHAIKGSLTHRSSSQGCAPGVLPLCVCMYVCVCVCVFDGGLSIFLFVFGWRVCVWCGK